MRILVFFMLALIAAPAYSQITIGRYRVNGTIEINADLQIEEVVPMTTIPDPVAFWKASDLTSEYGSFDLTNNGSVELGKGGGKIGDGFVLDRLSGQYLSIANASAGQLKAASSTFTNGMTVQCWVYPISTPAFFTGYSMIATGDQFLASGPGWTFGLGTFGFGGDLRPGFAAKGTVLAFTNTQATVNQWNWIAARVTPTDPTATIEIFINDPTTPAGTFNGSSLANAWGEATGDFNIGSAANNSDLLMNGNIDMPAVWDTALSDAQITALYNDGDGVELPLPIDPVPEANLHSAVPGACERRTEVQRSCETRTAVSQSNVLRKTVTVPHPQ